MNQSVLSSVEMSETLPGFQVLRTLYKSERSLVQRVRRLVDGRILILKFLSAPYPSNLQISQLRNEFQIARSLVGDFVCPALDFVPFGQRYVLVLENFDAPALADLPPGPLEMGVFMRLAILLSRALADLHAQGIIHKDISLGNVLWEMQGQQLRIVDFGVSQKMGREKSDLIQHQVVGTLPCISPEQTGRMNRTVDHRSDLYSLGIVLYRLATGVYPFEDQDPLRVIHAHLAQIPTSPDHLIPEIPSKLAQIILKLIEKKAEDRYQHAHALIEDLERLESLLELGGDIPDFEIASQNHSPYFSLSQNLYGRETQMRTLVDAFGRSSTGFFEIQFLAGEGGMGKTALADELQSHVYRKGGLFLRGDHEVFAKDRPYAGFCETIEQFLQTLEHRSADELEFWKDRFSTALHGQGAELLQVFPALRDFVQEQELGFDFGAEEQNRRFHQCFKNIVQSLGTESAPVVLFLDNLQWADAASLTLIESLAQDFDAQYLMVLGAFRRADLAPNHGLHLTLDALSKAHAQMSILEMSPLSQENILVLLSDSFVGDLGALQGLAKLCFAKTEGNPFFLHQFLHELHQSGALDFDHHQGCWHFDLGQIAQSTPTENVFEYMLSKVSSLDESCQNLLQWIACAGSGLILDDLAQLTQTAAEQLLQVLDPALDMGLIRLVSQKRAAGEWVELQFTHDRIQQACYISGPVMDCEQRHLLLAQFLHQREARVADEQLFEVCSQYNRAARMIPIVQKVAVAELNLRACQRALESAAYCIALDYARSGLRNLSDQVWNQNLQLRIGLYSFGIKAARLCQNYTEMLDMGDKLLSHRLPIADRLMAMEELIQYYVAGAEIAKGVQLALDLFQELGLGIPPKARLHHALGEMGKTFVKLKTKPHFKLSQLDKMSDPQMLIAMRVFATISSAAYIVNPNLFALLIFKVINLSVKFGHSHWSPFFYSMFGLVLAAQFGQVEQGRAVGQFAEELSRDPFFRRSRPRVLFVQNIFIRPFVDPLNQTLAGLSESHRLAMETGDYEFAMHAMSGSCYHTFYMGTPQGEMAQQVDAALMAMKRLEQWLDHGFTLVFRQAIDHLMTGFDENSFSGPYFDKETVNKPENKENHTLQALYCLLKMQLHIFFETPEQALELDSRMQKNIQALTGFSMQIDYYFYSALLPLSLWIKQGQRPETQLFKLYRRGLKMLIRASKFAPENHLFKLQLLRATYVGLCGQTEKALGLYRQCLSLNARMGGSSLSGLAFLFMSHFWQQRHENTLQSHYLNLALYEFEKWEALGLVESMRERYQNHLGHLQINTSGISVTQSMVSQSSGTSTHALDFESVIRASQALSREIHLENLLSAMMKIVMENAGADRAHFVMLQEGKAFLEASAELSRGQILHKVLLHHPLRSVEQLAQSVVQYVLRKQQVLVLGHACKEGAFSHDPYIVQSQLMSILCLPLESKQRLLGVLYLENHVIDHAFVPQRVKVLQILASEMAISLENASLYRHLEQTNAELEQKVADRTHELLRMNAQLQQKNAKIDKLLLNTLPERIVRQLKESGLMEPESFDNVAVFFSDFVGFTRMVAELPPKLVLAELNELFTVFDQIMSRYGCERIKTIGDGYMAVAGIPDFIPHCAANLVEAGLEMIDFLRKRNQDHELQWEVRIGIHCGPVVGGVVGVHKYIYDVFGDTINMAARMEQNSMPMKINLSSRAAQCLGHRYLLESRTLEIKDRGPVESFLVQDRILGGIACEACPTCKKISP